MSVAALRKWTELQLADTVKGVVAAIGSTRLAARAASSYPRSRTSFGNLGPVDRGAAAAAAKARRRRGQAKEQPLAPAGYLGLSDVPLAAVLDAEDEGAAPAPRLPPAPAPRRTATSSRRRREATGGSRTATKPDQRGRL